MEKVMRLILEEVIMSDGEMYPCINTEKKID